MRCAVNLPVVLIAFVTVFSGCGGEQDAEPGTPAKPAKPATAATPGTPEASATPEAAFAAFQEAAKKNDWKTVAELLTPESQESMAAGMLVGASLIAAFEEEKGKEFEQLMSKHGLDVDPEEGPPGMEDASMEDALKAVISPIKDKPAFIADMVGWLEENADDSGFDEIGSATLSDLTITGDTASGTLTVNDEPQPIEFRRSNGRWLIQMPEDEIGMDSSVEITSDMGLAGGFEDFGDDFSFGFEEEDPLPPVEAVTIDEFNSAWQTSLDVSDKPAIEVLRQLAEECGLELQEEDDVAEALAKPVTVKLDAVSRLAAIEEIAGQVGLYPRYTLRKLGFRQGPRPLPAVFAGPFLVEVAGLDEAVPYATGSVELRLLAAAIPTPAIAQIKSLNYSMDVEEDDVLTFRLLEVAGTGGQDILRDNSVGMMPQATRTMIVLERTVDLKNLVRSVEQIEQLNGELSFALPTKMTTLKFANIGKGTAASAEGISMEISSVHPGEMSTIEVEFEGIGSDRVTIVPLDADGEAMEVNGSSGSSFGEKGFRSVFMEGTPASIEARVIQETERVRVPFELGGIALESHGQMPEAIEPLKFEGDQPITVEFVEFKGSGDSKEIVLRVANHTNKDLAMVHLQLNYFDASDNKLDDSPHGHSGGRSFVAAGDTEDIEVSTFFMPDNTESIRVDVKSATFADATEWEGS